MVFLMFFFLDGSRLGEKSSEARVREEERERGIFSLIPSFFLPNGDWIGLCKTNRELVFIGQNSHKVIH
jgi:hypothetical protein